MHGHNITFKRFVADNVFDFVHIFGYKFRLPYMPAVENIGLEPANHRGSDWLWDGSNTRLDHGTGFQWYINPWGPDVGDLRTWTDINGGSWVSMGNMPLDTEWHEVRLVLDVQREATALLNRRHALPVPFQPDTEATQLG